MTKRAAKEFRYVILGFPRSGTTLLSRLLDAHSEISCPPESFVFPAAAGFLNEQTHVEGPPIGVLSGLSFLGIPPSDVMQKLRDLTFGFHEQIAAGAPIWVEKTATVVFDIETLEEMLQGHVRFIVMTRNPLDVVPSNVDLADRMGAQLSALHRLTRDYPNRYEGMAAAWVDRTNAIDRFVERHTQDCFRLKYEELTGHPEDTLGTLFNWMSCADQSADIARNGLRREPRFGLGDYRVNETDEIKAFNPNAWRKRLPRATASRIVPLLAPLMEAHGYEVPRVPSLVSREVAVKQLEMAAQIQRSHKLAQTGQ